jgi:hypothetical protein
MKEGRRRDEGGTKEGSRRNEGRTKEVQKEVQKEEQGRREEEKKTNVPVLVKKSKKIRRSFWIILRNMFFIIFISILVIEGRYIGPVVCQSRLGEEGGEEKGEGGRRGRWRKKDKAERGANEGGWR